jgi:D-alanine--poly(phosphoribitol) ligase subunit 1
VAEAVRELASALRTVEGVREAQVVPVVGEIGSEGAPELACFVVPDDAKLPPAAGLADDAQVERWRKVFDLMHTRGSGTSSDPSERPRPRWTSSYTRRAFPDEEIEDWIASTLRLVRGLRPARVLEIGVGSGVLCARLAPDCESYLGTDFSARSLAELAAYLADARPPLPQVTLKERAAHDFSGLADDTFDTVIVNSVAQYFPDLTYLDAVITGALRVTRPGGTILFGDLRSLPLLGPYCASLELSRAPAALPLQALALRVQRRMADQDELLVSPAYFAGWCHPKIARVEVLPKGGRCDNELSAYRFEAVIHVGQVGDDAPAPIAPTWIDWEPSLDEPRLAETLAETLPDRWALRGIANARVERHAAAWAKLRAAPSGDVQSLAAELDARRWPGLSPERISALGEAAGRRVRLSFARGSSDGSFDAVFERPELPTLPIAWTRSTEPGRSGNDPARHARRQRLVPLLRAHGERLLPPGWRLSSISLVDELPERPSIETRSEEAAFNLAWPMYRWAERLPEAVALQVDGRALSYAELRAQVQRVAGWLAGAALGANPRVAIFARRSLETYVGILGTCWAGGTYVPINPTLPEERLAQMLGAVEPHAIIVDRAHFALLTPRLRGRARVLAPWLDGAPPPDQTVDDTRALPAYDPADAPRPVTEAHPGYIEFTSGTTGVPKGVVVPVRAVGQFVAVNRDLFEVGPSDRTAGLAEITFDISVFDMFFTWDRGAALCVVPATQTMAPLRYLQEQAITVLFSVPSMIEMMSRMKLLQPKGLPRLRVSIFSGEPLPVTLAEIWRAAAPASTLDNFYGPTEAAVACSRERFDGAERTPSERGIVSIGRPFPGTRLAVLDPQRQMAAPGQAGELAIGGAQLALGYYGDLERTAQKFVTLGAERWYLTGDQARVDADGRYFYLGRLDNQVKVRGHRVELEEVEAHLRAVSGVDAVAVVAWPVRDGTADGVVAFLGDESLAARAAEIRKGLRGRLPGHMVPTALHFLPALPLSVNGKIDRRALTARLAAGGA